MESYILPGRKPGQATIADYTQAVRNIWRNSDGYDYHPSGGRLKGSVCYDGSNTNRIREMRAGILLAQLTSAPSLWVPCIRTTILTAAATAAAFTVNKPHHLYVGCPIQVNGAGTTRNVLTVDYTTGAVTVDGNLTWTTSQPITGTDGAGTCRGILDEFRLVVDPITGLADNFDIKVVIAGNVEKSMVIGDIDAVLADTTSANLLRDLRFHTGPVMQ